MLGRIGERLTYANVASTLALFLVLGGGAAYAANTVFSSDIVDGEVKSADIGTGQVRSPDVRDDTLNGGGLGSQDISLGAIGSSEVADDALTGAEILDGGLTSVDVLNDSLSGKDINELSGDDVNDNTLSGADIANATSGADDVNADRVDGRHVCRGEASAGSSFTTICASGALTIEASCTPVSSNSASGVARLRTSQSSNAFYVINGSSSSTDANFTAGDGPATLVSLAGGPAGAVSPTITRFHASSETGQLTGSIAARVFAFSSTNASCEFTMDILG